MKKVVIAGGTGFVGTFLSKKLIDLGYEIVIVSRSKHHPKKEHISYASYSELSESVNGSVAVINLAGYNLFDDRWTEAIKKTIVSSRVETTQKLVNAINAAASKPEVFISASAVGIYGNRGAEFLREDSPIGSDFLADVCKQWEDEAQKIKAVRLVIPRIGIVLEKNGGALGKMLTPFKLFVGGPLGNGKQFFPWIHMEDVVNSIIQAITNTKFEGVFNCVAPQPVTMAQFAAVLGDVLHRPSLFAVPEFALSLLLGEATGALVASQRVVPQKLKEWGFEFAHEDLKMALKSAIA